MSIQNCARLPPRVSRSISPLRDADPSTSFRPFEANISSIERPSFVPDSETPEESTSNGSHPSCGLREDRTIASPGFEVAAGRRTSTSRGSSLDSQPFLAPAHHLVVRPRECATPVPRPTYEPTNLQRTIPSNNSIHECRDRPSDRIEKPMKPDGLRSKLPALVEMLASEASLAVGGITLRNTLRRAK